MDSNQTPRFYIGQALKASDLNSLSDAINRGSTSDFDITTSGSLSIAKRRLWNNSNSGLDLKDVDFGYFNIKSILRKVSFNAGIFKIAQQHFNVTGSTDVVISNSPSYIYLEYIRGGSPMLMPPTSDLNATISDTNAYRHLLYTFTILTKGGLQTPTIHHLGGVQVGAYWT